MAKQANGTITVESSPGAGSTFKVWFPAAASTAAAVDAEPAVPVSGGAETILIVEDEPAVRAFGSRLLRGLGYRVLTATDGLDALEEMERCGWQVDLVVSDLVMPKMNGRELARRIKARDPRLKVMFVSGYSPEILLARGALPADVPLLQKPFTTESLAKAVRDLLDAPPLTAAARATG